MGGARWVQGGDKWRSGDAFVSRTVGVTWLGLVE